MQQITIEDRVYDAVSTEAARLNLNIDTYVSTVLMREIGLSVKWEPRSKLESGIGLFADLPDSFDDVMQSILDDRNPPTESVKDEVDRRIREAGSPAKALFGLFADEPELVDAVLADIMESRSKQWRLPDEKITS